MSDRNTKGNRDIGKRRFRKVRVPRPPDPTMEEIDALGEDLNSKLITPAVNVDRDSDIQTIHIETFK